MNRHESISVALAAALVVLIVTVASGQDGGQKSLTIPQRPVSQILYSDGTLRLEPGLQGSFDPQGFRMVVSKEGEPRFLPTEARLQGQDQSITADGDQNWDPQFGDFFTNGPTYAIAVADYTQIFIGGDFAQVGGRQNLPVQNIAEWENEDWTQNAVNGPVNAIAVSGTDVYVGGTFTQTDDWTAVNNIAKFNITTRRWSALSTGLNDTVNVIGISGTDVYVGGYFTQAGGFPANRIAKWNGTSWSALGSGVSGSVWGIGVNGTDVYVGGAFTQAGGISTIGIARWNGASWSAIGGGVNNTVVSIAFGGTDVYVGGAFTQAGGSPASYIAKWNGASWSALGSGMNSAVYSVAVYGTDVYAGGTFTQAGGDPASRIAKWNGANWASLGSGTDNTVWELEVIGTDIFVGGTFHSAGGGPACNIAIWDGTNWALRGSGLNDSVNALAASGENVYAGGWFSQAGGLSVSNIAKWNGMNWSALGLGTDSPVEAIATNGTDVYAGGYFTQAGGAQANYIAKWNGASWSALGSGVNGYVNRIAVSGTDVYVAGSFTQAGSTPVNHIAKWNGASWSALGSGVNGYVAAIAVSGTDVYVAGSFTQAGGIPVNYIAKWNGTTWSALGSGANDYVYAIAASGANVYVGGYFTQAGGISANHIAKWNGTTWSALGSGVNSFVGSIAASGTDVYVGGSFTQAGGIPANCIAKWTGTAWLALGSGSEEAVGIAVTRTGVYVGGQFDRVGGKPSYHFGRWMLPFSVTSPDGGESWEAGSLQDITWAGTVGPVRIEYSIDDGLTWETIIASTDNDGIYSWTVPNTPSASCRVRVSEAADGDPVDASDGTFMIAGFRVTSPNGGESWASGSPQLITWTTAGGFPIVRIELSTDNGSSWSAIASEIANTGSYAWTVAGPASSQCLIRIADPTDGYPSDISNAVFSIISTVPHTVSTPSVPSGPQSPAVGTPSVYTTGGSSCNFGHDVQYRFEWLNGDYSDWLPVGQTSLSHIWTSPTGIWVRAQARCATEPSFVSSWSNYSVGTATLAIPFAERFDGPWIPAGWAQGAVGGPGAAWSVAQTNNAGGQPNEARCQGSDPYPSLSRFITPAINTSGQYCLRLRFVHVLSANEISGLQLKIQTSADKLSWTDEAWLITTTGDDIGPETVDILLTHNLNQPMTFVSFVITGSMGFFEYWCIDDISISSSSAKVDFNGDGQEDILWRYHGEGAFQGLNVVWLMNQTGIPSPAPQKADLNSARGMSLISGARSGVIYQAPNGAGAPPAPGSIGRVKTVLSGEKTPVLNAGRVMRDPRARDHMRGRSMPEKERGRREDRTDILVRQDAANTSALDDGSAKIATLQLATEVVFSQIADTGWETAGTGDFNGDTKTDILWRYYGQGPYQGLNDIWFMDGTTFVSENVFSQIADTNWRIAGTGDFNGDAKTDILWRYYGTGAYQGLNVIWHMNGATFVGETVFSQVWDTDWRIEGTGDFNGDGETDILWRYYGTGAYQGLNDIWFMNDATFISESVFSQILDTAWQIGGTGDFNGDGHLDILWRYYGAGTYQGLNDIWYMNGTTFLSEEVFSLIPDTNWRIVNR